MGTFLQRTLFLKSQRPWRGWSRHGRLGKPYRVALVLVCCFAAGWWTSLGCAAKRTGLNTPLVAEAWHAIDSHYVQRNAVNTQAMTYGAIRGMVDALGDTGHSTFLTPAMAKALRQVRNGELKGIGVEIEMKNGHVVVVAPIDGSPAQRAGLKPGDILVKVGGQDISDWPISRVVERVTGPPGTYVSLTLQDPRTEHVRQVKLQRASIKLHDITWQQLPGTRIVHLRVARFDDGVAKELRQALSAIQQRSVDGLILDLRNNPGGLLSEAVTVGSQFLRSGNVLEVKDAKGRIAPVPVEGGGLAYDLPVIVLINEGSASAAEIVAGAFKDTGRALLVGDKTFGTGTVLSEFRLSDGSALLLAVEEWLTPHGNSFWHKGVAPDIAVTLPEGQNPLLPEAERELDSVQFRASGDQQLIRALDQLTSDLKSMTRASSPAPVRR
jgi:carboxyl-terminal processing protease